MATAFTWIWKYKKYVDDHVWSMAGMVLWDYSAGPKVAGKDGKDSREFEIDDLLRPELFILGFLESIYFAKIFRENLIEISDDLKSGNMKTEEFCVKIDSYIKNERFRDMVISCREISDEVKKEEQEKLIELFMRIYHFEYKKKDEDDEDPLGAFCEWYKKAVWQYVTAKKDKDREFIDEMKKYFMNPRSTGHLISPREMLYFCLDYMKVKEKEEKSFDFVKLSQKYTGLQKEISERVIGQDTAVRRFIQELFNAQLRKNEKQHGPEGSFLFVGPPGVGKTFLAQTAGELSGRPFKVFDMSEYAGHNSFNGLVGFEPTWKDSKEGDLTSFVSENENAILVFDEIEKAHIKTIHLFLSILEGGYLRDLYTQADVDFTHTTIIFTTNAGRDFYEEKRGMSISALSEATILDALKKDLNGDGTPKMPAEILSRLSKGSIIGFDHMDPAKLIPIIRKGMEKGADIVEETMRMKCQYDNSLLPYLFLYHMGGDLDARVAAARSESFIKDSIFHISERAGANPKKYEKQTGGKSISIHFDVEENDLAKELTRPQETPVVLVVCNQADLSKIKAANKEYSVIHVQAEKEDRDYKSFIEKELRESNIAAIIVDPFMREKKKGQSLEGLSNLDTIGNSVIDWLSKQRSKPPVYCVELHDKHRISFVDLQELRQRGVKGILKLADAANAKERTNMIYATLYEIFLNGKLAWLHSRGKALEFESGNMIESNDDEAVITVRLHDFRLVRSMDTKAQELFVDDEKLSKDSFDSVVGGESAKEELRRFVKFIKDPAMYRRSGQQISKGILMYGPPGSGKTKLARALAGEADCPFVSATGTQFINGEKSMAEVFRIARKYAPSIVFIDEIESFALDSRVGRNYPEITKQLLTEMDGFDKSDKPVFVIAATNAAKAPNLGERNVFLDDALLRRFSKKVYMRWPDRDERVDFVKMKKEQLKNMVYNFNGLSDDDIIDFAFLTAGHSLSEIQTVLEQTIGRAAETDTQPNKEMLFTCFEEAVYGEERNYAKEHIRVTALHEAGHAFMGFYCDEGANSRFLPEYATIIARGGYLGMVRQKSDETRSGYSKNELLKLIRIKLAGRAAEIIFSEKMEEGLTTGASNDLESATDIVGDLLCRYGMEEDFMATLPLEMMMKSPVAAQYYEKLNNILKREMDITEKVIAENKEKIEALADALLDRSRLDTDEMREILYNKQ